MNSRPTRRDLATSAATLLATFFIGSAKGQTGSESTLDRVNRTKQLRVAVVANSPTYFQKNALTGTWKGAAIEMAKGTASV